MENAQKILITGAAGFVGARLARACLAAGDDVTVLLRPSSDAWRIRDILPRLSRVEGDLTDAVDVRRIMDEASPDGIFHCAASNIMSGVIASSDEVIRVNLQGTVHLMDAAAASGVKFFVNSGTFLEYAPQTRPIRESDPCAPPEIYSISKLAATLYGQAVYRTKGLAVVTLRLFTPYGPGLQKGRLAYELITRALRHDDISLTAPSVARDFIFVDDLAELYRAAGRHAVSYAGRIFNAGSAVSVTLGDLVRMVLEMTGSHSRVIWGDRPAVAYDATAWCADMKKTRDSLGWRPRHTLEDGLRETIEWYRRELRK
jgi:nucleoside-diphosphate-sugar epimerase